MKKQDKEKLEKYKSSLAKTLGYNDIDRILGYPAYALAQKVIDFMIELSKEKQ